MNTLVILGSALTAIAIVAACGGNVVVDTGASGTGAAVGAGAAGGAVGAGAAIGAGGAVAAGGAGGVGGTGASCMPPSVSTSWPSCSTSASSGGPSICVFIACDGPESMSSWMATCMGNTCVCEEQVEGTTFSTCSCALPEGTQDCAANCCFPM
jgi:hypothetical protein